MYTGVSTCECGILILVTSSDPRVDWDELALYTYHTDSVAYTVYRRTGGGYCIILCQYKVYIYMFI